MSSLNYIRLSQLAGWVQQTIEDTLGAYAFWVIADVTSHTYKAGSRHHYFELVEKEQTGSAILARFAARAWQDGAERIAAFEQATGQRFTNGIQVLVQVSIQYHPAFGLQLVLMDIDTNYTLGALEKQKQATLQRLLEENPDHVQLINENFVTANQQLQLNRVIQRVAVISSSTSAGYEDFLHTLEQNTFGYRLLVDNYFAVVQGENNTKQLVDKLIEIFHSGINYDAVVIIRGGGAQTDFLLFEQYAIGRAIARFPFPVITGIGHQKNETIADIMAHTAVKTPTKAAEFIIAHNRSFEDEVLLLEQSVIIKAQQLLATHRNELLQLKSRLTSNTAAYMTQRRESLNRQNQLLTTQSRNLLFHHQSAMVKLSSNLSAKAQLLLRDRINNLSLVQDRLKLVTSFYLKNRQSDLIHHRKLLKAISPANVLNKGFALIKEAGKIISTAENIQKEAVIEVIFAKHKITTQVTGKTDYDGAELNL